jgi:hypothetical protein
MERWIKRVGEWVGDWNRRHLLATTRHQEEDDEEEDGRVFSFGFCLS